MGMKNKGRHFTVVVIPHMEEAVWSLRIPLYILQLSAVCLVFFLLAAFVVIQSYQKLKQENLSAKLLWDENRILSEEVDRLASKTEVLLAQLQEVEELGHELRQLLDLPGTRENKENPLPALALNQGNAPRLLAGRGGNQVISRTEANISVLQEVLPARLAEMVQLKEEILECRRELAATPSLWPTRGRVTSEFGPRRSPFTGRKEFHDGIDIAASRGAPVYATADGRVSIAAYRRGIGNVIVIDHGYGYQTLYGHLSAFAAKEGAEIKKGQLIGYVGNTGASTGPHLHYTVFVHGVAVNPREFMP